MIIAVTFLKPITTEPWPEGRETWRASDDAGPSSRFPIACEDKGTHMLLTWTGRSEKFKGKACRVKVPLTNIAQVFEVVDEPKKDGK
jgi:hypothetical protein